LVFIKKGGEIRLCDALATNSSTDGERCQNLIPESREMIKIKTRKNVPDSTDKQHYFTTHAYAHVPVRALIAISEIFK
jgi:hypothetical protein